jgi:hypothetical protein
LASLPPLLLPLAGSAADALYRRDLEELKAATRSVEAFAAYWAKVADEAAARLGPAYV